MEYKISHKGLFFTIFIRLNAMIIAIGITLLAIIFFTNDYSLENCPSPLNIIELYLWLSLACGLIGIAYTVDIKATRIYIQDNKLYSYGFLGIKRSIPLQHIRHMYKHGFIINNITVESTSLFSSYSQILIYKKTENLEELLNTMKPKVNSSVRAQISTFLKDI